MDWEPPQNPGRFSLVEAGVPAAEVAGEIVPLSYARQGTITQPHLTGQTEQAWCLTVLTNSVITWTT